MKKTGPILPTDELRTISFDFDDTLARSVWPEPGIGDPIPDGLSLLEFYFRNGYRIWVFTARHWADHADIVTWLDSHAPGMVDQVICGKPLASLYVDDRAMRFVESKNERRV